MTITKQQIKDVNSIIEEIAENYFETPQEYENGKSYQMRWADCVDHAKDDFCDDVKGYMEEKGYDLTAEECADLDIYAMNYVTTKTIRENV